MVRRGDVIDYADISDFVNLFFENLVLHDGFDPPSLNYQSSVLATELMEVKHQTGSHIKRRFGDCQEKIGWTGEF